MEKNIITALNWRYATKVFDKNKQISGENFDILLESLRLTPSSFGLQPWKFIVVKNPEIREQIKGAAYGQSQITDASELIVLCAKENITEADVTKITGDNEAYKNMIMGAITGKNAQDLLHWNAKQVYIALGFLMETAAMLEIDACPIEGFDNSKVDQILGLKEKGLRSVVICPVGYRSADDKYGASTKTRFLTSEVTEVVE